MSTVRAKFKVVSITRREGWGDNKEIYDVKLNPVVGGSEENKQFFASTPTGEILIGCANPIAAAGFLLGHEYYVDFTAVKPKQETT